MIDGEMRDAYTDSVTIPAQRVGWAHRELQKAGMLQQSQSNGDGSHTFQVDAQNGAILQSVIDHKTSKKPFGAHPAHKGVNTVAALIAMLAGAGVLVLSLLSGSFVFVVPTLALLAFIWGARRILNSERRLFRGGK